MAENPVPGTVLDETRARFKKWPDIRQTGTGTGYPVHPYLIYILYCNKVEFFCRHIFFLILQFLAA